MTWFPRRLQRPSAGLAAPAPARLAAGRAFEPIAFEWLALAGLFAFASWLLGVQGVWRLLLSSDPTGITAVIILIFGVSTVWCGWRARELSTQHALMLEAARVTSDRASLDPSNITGEGWAADYWRALRRPSPDADAPLDILLEHAQGPHGTAWWVNGIQLKLGLLGKVIGFSVLALQIGQIQSFDASQSQELLKSLTQGLGIALLTTMVGLVGNILLGLQLTRLDRFADALVTRAQVEGLRLAGGAAASSGPSSGPSSAPTAAPPG